MRITTWCVLIAAMIVPIIQLEHKTLKNIQKRQAWLEKRESGTLSEKQLKKAPKGHKGAVNRWAKDVRKVWGGENVYQTKEVADSLETPTQAADPTQKNPSLHPNMPFVVILLTPSSLLPMAWGGLLFTILKVFAVLAAGLGAVAVANHKSLRMPDWVVGLGVAWWVTLAISDIQHGNTNGFVFAFIVLQLWLFRKGREGLAGASLAVAICLKMTPVLFVLYWAYQRRWKVVLGCLAAGVLFVAVIPAVAFGPSRAWELTDTWMDNLIFKGVGGAWYPVHINQSLHGTLSRYLMDGQPGGDINWNPDDKPDYDIYRTMHHQPGNEDLTPEWIAVASLSEGKTLAIIRTLQVLIMAILALAVGWRVLPRDDGRRGLHYAMILSAMLLLNQRSWGHHAAYLLPGTLAIWYAISFGRFSKRARRWALGLMLSAGALLLLSAGEMLTLFGKLAGAEHPDLYANRLDAYGPRCAFFLLLFITATVLTFAMKKQSDPYATLRQKL